MSRERGGLLALPMAAAAVAALAGTLAGGALYYRDLILLHRPLRTVVRRLWGAGHLPLWDAGQDGGRVLLANPNHRILHPTALLDLFLSVDAAMAAAVMLHIFLAGWGLALLLRQHGATTAAARLGGLAWALCGPLLSLGNLPNLMGSMAWVPLILYAGVRAWGAGTAWLPAAVLLAAVPLLAGGVEALGAALLILLLLAAGAGAQRRRGVLVATAVGAGAVLLAAVQVLPAVAALQGSERGLGLGGGLALRWSMAPARLAEMVLPALWGVPTDHLSWGGAALFDDGLPLILSSYLGAAVLVLAAVGVGGVVRPHALGGPPQAGATDGALPAPFRRLLAALSVGGGLLLLLALGRYNPLLVIAVDLWPGAGWLRYPERLLPLAVLPLPVAAAAGWQILERCRRQQRRLPLGLWLGIGCVAAVSVAAPALMSAGFWPAPRNASAAARLLPSLTAAAVTVMAGACIWLARLRPGAAGALVTLVVAADLLAVGLPLNPTVDRRLLVSEPAAAAFLRQQINEMPRLLRQAEPPVRGENIVAGQEALWSRGTLTAKVALESGVGTSLARDVDRSTPLGNAFLRVAHERADVAAASRLADRAAANWELGFAGLVPQATALTAPFREEVLPGTPEVFLWPRPGAVPRLTLVPSGLAVGDLQAAGTMDLLVALMGAADSDPGRQVFLAGAGVSSVDGGWEPGSGRVHLVEEAPTRVEVTCDAPGPAVLVLRDTLMPGWRVEVDDQESRLLRADLAWRGVEVSAGPHRVVFTYQQPGLAVGAAVSAATAMALALLLVAAWWRRSAAAPGARGPGRPLRQVA